MLLLWKFKLLLVPALVPLPAWPTLPASDSHHLLGASAYVDTVRHLLNALPPCAEYRQIPFHLIRTTEWTKTGSSMCGETELQTAQPSMSCPWVGAWLWGSQF